MTSSTSAAAIPSSVTSTSSTIVSTPVETPTRSFGVPFPTTFSPTAVAASSNSNNGGPSGLSSASNLYLYTFLATLVLLLLVSGGVIMRSISLRIRARRRIEEAIRNGTYVAPMDGVHRKNLVKPVSYEARLKGQGADLAEKGIDWHTMQPMAASFIAPPDYVPAAPTTLPTANQSFLARIRNRVAAHFAAVHFQDIIDEINARDLHARIAQRGGRAEAPMPNQSELAAAAFNDDHSTNQSTQSPDTSTQNQEVGATRDATQRPQAVRVAVLIAMPDPGRSSRQGRNGPGASVSSVDGAEEDLPFVEFGVAEVPFSSSSTQIPRST